MSNEMMDDSDRVVADEVRVTLPKKRSKWSVWPISPTCPSCGDGGTLAKGDTHEACYVSCCGGYYWRPDSTTNRSEGGEEE